MIKNEELAAKVFIAWNFNSKKEFSNNPEIVDGGDFLSTILYRKMKAVDLGVNIPDECYLLISLCSDSPGYAQLLLKELLLSIPNLKKGYTIIPMDFARKFPMEYPMSDNPKWEKYFSQKWDEQKIHSAKFPYSDNLCDTAEWWLEVLN